jgi:hypothetical protein
VLTVGVIDNNDVVVDRRRERTEAAAEQRAAVAVRRVADREERDFKVPEYLRRLLVRRVVYAKVANAPLWTLRPVHVRDCAGGTATAAEDRFGVAGVNPVRFT